MESSDIQLLRRYANDGDELAFAQLVERHGEWIFAAARRRLADDHLAEDATQAVFIVLASKARQLVESDQSSLPAWLFHVMHFTCARLRRTQSRHVELNELHSPPQARNVERDLTRDEELLLLMEDSIAQLPAVEREMVVRRFYRRESFGEIGAALNVSAEAARKRVSRALATTRAVMLRDGADAIPDAFQPDLTRTSAHARNNRINARVKEETAMAEQQAPSPGGFQLISAEFLVMDVEANLEFFEKLGFPRRFIDKPDAIGRVPRASLTAGHFGKIWIRRAAESEIRPSPSINVFFWVDGGPDALMAHRRKIADAGVPVTSIIDEHGLPNFNVTTPDGYSIAFFTQYVP